VQNIVIYFHIVFAKICSKVFAELVPVRFGQKPYKIMTFLAEVNTVCRWSEGGRADACWDEKVLECEWRRHTHRDDSADDDDDAGGL